MESQGKDKTVANGGQHEEDSAASHQVSENPTPKILSRHYATIGMEDVFLEAPPHPLPSVYLNNTSSLPKESFVSWEIVGTIKSTPEDFCVREIFQRDRRIPGLSDDDHKKLRIADILPPEHLPTQRLELPTAPEIETTKGGGAIKTTEIDDDTVQEDAIKVDEPSSASVIRTYLSQVSESSENPEKAADVLIDLLDTIHTSASARISSISSGNETQTAASMETVWIPPFVKAEGNRDSSSTSPRETRGTFHRAIKVEYPLLCSRSSTKEGSDHWISVHVDDSYDALVPFLLDPVGDIRSLLRFQKQGVESVSGGGQGTRALENSSAKVILKLRPSVTKDQRRDFHRTLSDRCKLFDTSTISDFALDDGTKTSAVVVSWHKSSIGRKRKRNDKSKDGAPPNPYPNVLVVLKKRQREHLTAIHKLENVIKCRQSDIGLAGIKDLQAVTFQFCTFRNMKVGRIQSANKQLMKQGMELGHFYRVNWLLNNGDLEGNDFTLVIRGLKRIQVNWTDDIASESLVPCDEGHVLQMVERLRRNGFVNFFGEQRVGSAGSVEDVGFRAFDIGRAMLQQNYMQAIELLMTGRTSEDSRESEAAKKVRQIWKETNGDPDATLKAFQGADNILSRERMVLKGLHRYGKDRPLDALRCLSHSMRTFWINAYQSYIWNQVASARIQRHGTVAVKGDLYQEDGSDEVKVVETNENDVPFSQVVLPLPGYNIQYPENDIGELYNGLLEKDLVKFEKTAPTESRAKGSYRKLIVRPLEVASEFVESDAIRLSFQLPKGCYATMCLRELMFTTGTR